MFRQLTVQEAIARWEELAPRLDKAIEYSHGDFNLSDVCEGVMQGKMQLWVLESITGKLHSICATELIDYARRRACSIVLAEGQTDFRWGAALEIIARWARAESCTRIEAHARKGWTKKADKFGFKHLDTAIYKDL